MKKYNIAILGATGAVGLRMRKQLEKSFIPVKNLKLLATKKSVGKKQTFRGKTFTVEEAKPEAFSKIDLVLSSAGGSVSKKLLPEAVRRGAVCVDNTSYFRMNDHVPLVVPEVNSGVLTNHKGIISDPNCSTIQMVVALKPIFDKLGLKQIIVSSYQAASGAGQKGSNELREQSLAYLKQKDINKKIFPTKSDKKHYQLAFNLLPQIDVFEKNGYTHEEWKMVHETKKIFFNDVNSDKIKVTATSVRVPIFISHGESIYFQTKSNSVVSVDEMKKMISKGSGLILKDNDDEQIYPQPLEAQGKRETLVGRIRQDVENPGAYWMWVVSDNLLKGAAWNAVEIAEELVKNNLVFISNPEKSYELFKGK